MKEFAKSKLYWEHFQTHKSKIIPCDSTKTFGTKFALKRNQENTQIKCDVCQATVAKSSLDRHKKKSFCYIRKATAMCDWFQLL